MEERRLLISFSGGETSGLMAKLCKERLGNEYDRIETVFSNTSEENEATLVFVDECDRAFDLGVHWIEADVDPKLGVGTGFTKVDFASAHRHGEIFEAMIAKYGIPNKAFPHCTRELKARPILAFARDYLGWAPGTYDCAIGIRIDEIDRMSEKAKEQRLFYPFVSRWPHRKTGVNETWHAMPFRLRLKGYQGNCKWCWKKSLRKHLTLMVESPEVFEFPERMEAEHANTGSGEGSRVFFRENRSVADLRHLAETTKFKRATDDAREYQIDLYSPLALDLSGGCSESCEVNFDFDVDVLQTVAAHG
ncbi:hypothetical protein OLZ32_27855 [Rhizobium sp. 1AS11]|uniref:hypothetical protein n=1 Tax=Rhizobium acaciae TaxID=2989736 RepID=UPI0022225AFA|nr:hypothetical protein [Rhizobium acaciae]MCW1412168.1 hypothetical protein [Rhizobium acaciae]MCW1744183.1 hypothetical protein [Rhizobium acaciae]